MKLPIWANSLRVQVVLLLTLALFPLAAVAIYQTNRVENEASRNAELALLSLTRSAAKEEELFIHRALGIARFFASVAPRYQNNTQACVDDLENFVANNESYSFIGVLPPSGIMTCTSAGGVFDAKTGPYYADLMATRERAIIASPLGPLSNEPIFNINEPFDIDGEFAGFISISVPRRIMPQNSKDLIDLGLVELITINQQTELVSARGDLTAAQQELPLSIPAEEFSLRQGQVFEGRNQNNVRRTYTFVPIEGTQVTVVGVWHMDDSIAGQVNDIVKPAVFPILMWFASMAVAMLSIYTLVIRHITNLRRDMDGFAKTRSISTVSSPTVMPNELDALAKNFERMTDDIVREEAKMEDMLREKNVLIKEVHHRVKNNLQLISSIMNMKIRSANSQETKSVLMRLQDRVLSLASIHQDLHQSRHSGMANVGKLVSELVEKSVEVAALGKDSVRIETDIDPVLLYPDQAVPLALLVAEAMTNSLKNIGEGRDGHDYIRVLLKEDDGQCLLRLENSIGESHQTDGTGLGTKLIKAFSVQLGGEVSVEHTPTAYALSLRFKVQEFVPDGRDY